MEIRDLSNAHIELREKVVKHEGRLDHHARELGELKCITERTQKTADRAQGTADETNRHLENINLQIKTAGKTFKWTMFVAIIAVLFKVFGVIPVISKLVL